MTSILDIITGISQAVSNKQGGGTSFGLKRETEDLLQGKSNYDPVFIDGFNVQFQGNRMVLKYHCELPLVKVHDKSFETEIRGTVKEVVKHLKEEYKKVTKSALSLTEEGDLDILVQSANRRVAYVNATQIYKLAASDTKEKSYDSEQDRLSDMTRGWITGARKSE